MKLILASGSPRRRELLEMLNIEFEVIPAKGEELAHPELTPAELVKALSAAKAGEIAAAYPGAVVVGADTVVAADGAVLGKPRDAAEAAAMLRRLAGRAHEVYTGVTVRQGERTLSEAVCTAVRFRPMTEAEIAAYVATGEPMDKAGAYGAQGIGALFVEGIEGDFFNVVGLPLCTLSRMLKSFGVELL